MKAVTRQDYFCHFLCRFNFTFRKRLSCPGQFTTEMFLTEKSSKNNCLSTENRYIIIDYEAVQSHKTILEELRINYQKGVVLLQKSFCCVCYFPIAVIKYLNYCIPAGLEIMYLRLALNYWSSFFISECMSHRVWFLSCWRVNLKHHVCKASALYSSSRLLASNQHLREANQLKNRKMQHRLQGFYCDIFML